MGGGVVDAGRLTGAHMSTITYERLLAVPGTDPSGAHATPADPADRKGKLLPAFPVRAVVQPGGGLPAGGEAHAAAVDGPPGRDRAPDADASTADRAPSAGRRAADAASS